ncbi:MAG: hypothetical protein IJ084_07295 [Prevotella sp.]|nr:hypothetical protein [Prevotella sp.]
MTDWIEVHEEIKAPSKGLYLFEVLGDNHIFYELYKYDKGESLYKYFQGEYEHTDGYFVVKPYKNCFIPEYDAISWADYPKNGTLYVVAYGGGTNETPFGHLSTFDPLYKKVYPTPNAINYSIEYGEITMKDYINYIQIIK